MKLFLISLLTIMIFTGCGKEPEVLVKYVKVAPEHGLLTQIPPPRLKSSKEYIRLTIIGRERYLTRVLLKSFSINKKLNYRLKLLRDWYEEGNNTQEVVEEGY